MVRYFVLLETLVDFLKPQTTRKMKTFTTSLLVNRLLTFAISLIFILFAGNTVAIANSDTKSNTGNSIISGIEYATLTASATQKTVFIDWVTSYELNNSHFEVERSVDMKEFKTVAIVLDGFVAKGTGKSYKFKEDAGDVSKGKTVYYRLKQIGTDNLVHYSNVMAVQMNTTVTLFPSANPVSIKSTANSSNIDDIKILLSKQSTTSTLITNISVERLNVLSAGIFTGRIVMTETVLINKSPVFA